MVALLLAMTLAVQDSGAFVVRLGNDTLAMEQYTRTATQLRGEYVIRTPRSLHRIYTADLNPDGTVRRWELVTHNIGGGPGPMETKASVEFSGDTAVTVSPRGDSTMTSKFAVPHVWNVNERWRHDSQRTACCRSNIDGDTGNGALLLSASQQSGGDTPSTALHSRPDFRRATGSKYRGRHCWIW